MTEELLLASGVTAESALKAIDSLIVDARNLQNSAGGDFGRHWNGYLMWVEAAELSLSNLVQSPTVWQELHSSRYWHIRELGEGRPVRPFPLIANEAAWQARRLGSLSDQLQRLINAYGKLDPKELVVVPDTSFFMNHPRFYDEVDWSKEIHAGQARVVVPMLVIDELDDLSFRAMATSDRARKVIRSLRKLRGDASPEAVVEVRKKVSLQILSDPPHHRRRTNSDDEILARIEYLGSVVGLENIRVTTMDYGMELRGGSRGLEWVRVDWGAH